MKAPQSRASRHLLAGRTGRWTFSALVLLALLFLVMGRIDHPVVERLRRATDDISAPMLAILSRPVDRVDALIDWAGSVASLMAENARLRAENERLREWQATALALEQENERLRDLLNAPRLAARRIATARAVGVTGGPFARSIIVNIGRRHGLIGNEPAVDALGLVGRVVSVGANASRVLLVTDLNSRIPVRIQRTGAQAIARGRNDRFLTLAFLPPDADIMAGDAVVTSGDGGIFAPGILLGHIAETAADEVLLRPVALLDRLEYVDILMPLARMLEDGNGDGPDGMQSEDGTP